MDNTIENKIKFFALYWGIGCIANDDFVWHGNETLETVLSASKGDLSGWYATLKSLKDITNEDFEYIRPLVGYDNSEGGIKLVKRWLTPLYKDYDDLNYFALTDSKPTLRVLDIIDYLRSKGYALPWMDLSVEKQIEYGWVKIAKND